MAVICVLGLSLRARLHFADRWPDWFGGDATLYRNLAATVLRDHRFAVGPPQDPPVWGRLPGYPAFLIAIHAVDAHGHGNIRRALHANALLDTITLVLVALAVAVVVGRMSVFLPALVITALLPVDFGFVRWPLTEILTAAMLASSTVAALVAGRAREPLRWQHTSGWLIGLATLVRPDAILALATPATIAMFRGRRERQWRRMFWSLALLSAGALTPIVPWVIRNRVVCHTTKLAARYPDTAGNPQPIDDYAWWVRTWAINVQDTSVSIWELLGRGPLRFGKLPDRAFASLDERATVKALYDSYNKRALFRGLSPEEERGFARLALRRTLRHPLRTLVLVPLQALGSTWLGKRSEFLEVPPRDAEALSTLELRADRTAALLFPLSSIFIVFLAWKGTENERWRACLTLSVAFAVLVRAAFLAWFSNPDPRYAVLGEPLLLMVDCAAGFLALRRLVPLRERRHSTSVASAEVEKLQGEAQAGGARGNATGSLLP